MKALVWLLIVFAAAVGLVVFGRVGEGYVLIVHPPYRAELSLLVFGLLILLGVGVLYGAVRLVHLGLALPGHVRAYRERRERARAESALVSALRAYFEGRYARAEKEAEAAHEARRFPGLAALLAARAAHQLRDFAKRDRWLARAEDAGAEFAAARLMTQAELALEDRDHATARDALGRLQGAAARNVATLRMRLRAERGMGHWEEVLRIAEQLAKHDAIAPALAEEYRVQAIVELLRATASDRARFEERWRRFASRDQVHPRIAAAGARHATELGAAALAREIIEEGLGEEWSATLVRAYAQPGAVEAAARADEARVRIQRAEKWLGERAEDPVLLATLGELCTHAGLWGKAQNYFEASLSFEPNRRVQLELARLAERLGREADAQQHYRRAAELP